MIIIYIRHLNFFLKSFLKITLLTALQSYSTSHGILVLNKIKYPIASGGCAPRPLLRRLVLAPPLSTSKVHTCLCAYYSCEIMLITTILLS